MSDWRCGACSALNAEAAVVCENCAGISAATHVVAALSESAVGPAKWDQRCVVPGCAKTVGEHRDDVRRALALLAQRYP